MQHNLMVADPDVVSRCRAIVKAGAYTLLPRANRVMHTLPGLHGAQAQVLAAPPVSTYYVAHELIVEPGGGTTTRIHQPLESFIYVLEGSLNLDLDGTTRALAEGGFCWLPPNLAHGFESSADVATRVFWIRRKYQAAAGLSVPDPIVANERDVPALPEDTYMEQHLVPYENAAFDMGCNLLTFEPGTYFSFVESHIMEHALYMLAGRGIYWLNGDHMEVQPDDFIHMFAYCPQFIYATGWDKTRYIVYKDVNRDYDWTLDR